MRAILAATLSVWALGTHPAASAAEPITLKCEVANTNGPGTYDLWLVIDVEKSFMRVDGVLQPLSVTNDRYASRSTRIGNFVTVYSMSRQTGELTITDLYGSEVVGKRQGRCDRATPPATKF